MNTLAAREQALWVIFKRMVATYGADDPDTERARDRWMETANQLEWQCLQAE